MGPGVEGWGVGLRTKYLLLVILFGILGSYLFHAPQQAKGAFLNAW